MYQYDYICMCVARPGTIPKHIRCVFLVFPPWSLRNMDSVESVHPGVV